MKIDAIYFWRRVDELMRRSNLSLGEFSERSGIPYNTLVTQRTRKSIPKIEQLVDMAHTLETSVDYLVTGKETIDPLFSLLKANKPVRDLAHRLSHCETSHLHAIDVLLDTWRIEDAPGEAYGRGTMSV
jgi:transcriptional regulator with XRE-family HTH domain